MARPDKTILDYLIIAICPILIGLMAGALAYFLLECTYVGGHKERAQWIIFFCVLAMVGIARISIELGKGRAIMYGSVIALEILFCIQYLAPGASSIVIVIIIIVWFFVHKLTWNCTMIDEQEEDVGRGLLEPESLAKKGEEVEDGSELQPKTSQWRHWFSWPYLKDLLSEPEGKRHPPGAWIVYFAILAVPIFTLAQWMIPARSHESATKYVTIYLLSAMGLLVSTSLLGLRRYLRRRRAIMQQSMAVSWLTLGGTLIVVCIGLAMLLPRPTGSSSQRFAAMRKIFTFQEESPQSSPYSVGKDAVKDSEPSDKPSDKTKQSKNAKATKPGDKKSGKGDSKDAKGSKSSKSQDGKAKGGDSKDAKGSESQQGESKQSDSGDAKSSKSQSEKSKGDDSGDAKESESQQEQGEKGKESSSTKDSKASQSSKRTSKKSSSKKTDASRLRKSIPKKSHAQERPTPPRTPSVGSRGWSIGGLLLTILRWVVLAVILVFVCIVAYKHRGELLAALREILEAIRNFWANLFGGTKRRKKREKKKKAKAVVVEEPRIRFLDLPNPFTSGQAERMPVQELVKYTFEAIETWATDRECAREEDQTPGQFLNDITRKTRIPAESLRVFNQAYYSTTYDSLPETPEMRSLLLSHLGTIWRSMSSAIHVA